MDWCFKSAVPKSFSVRRNNSTSRKSALSVFAGILQSYNCTLSKIINTEHLILSYPAAVKASDTWTLLPPTFIAFGSFHLILFFSHVATAPREPEPPHYGCFTITLRHTILGRTSLDERSARRGDFHLKTHNTDNRQTSMKRRDLSGYLLLRNS